MKTYPIPMVPGPVTVHPDVLAAYQVDYGSGDLEPEFLDLYNQTEQNLQQIMATCNQVAILTGEGMLALWGALKSCLRPHDRVLALATGVFGYGIGDLARAVGADVETVGFGYDETLHDWDRIEAAISRHRPVMITAVHCETPSGTLNPMQYLGELKRKYQIPLLYVDAVASIGGAPVLTDEWGIDLCLGGSQKVLSVPPDMCFLSISETAWEIIEKVDYPGYDALKPFRSAQKNFAFPYTPNWHGLAALNVSTNLILKEGLEHSYARHEQVARLCRDRLAQLGLEILPVKDAVPSPTVTAVKVPESISWKELDIRFRKNGLVVGGSYGPLADKVFRLGHMGMQADANLVNQALDVIRGVMATL